MDVGQNTVSLRENIMRLYKHPEVKCNNCGEYWLDDCLPQIRVFEVKGDTEGEIISGCDNCGTDAYLSDVKYRRIL